MAVMCMVLVTTKGKHLSKDRLHKSTKIGIFGVQASCSEILLHGVLFSLPRSASDMAICLHDTADILLCSGPVQKVSERRLENSDDGKMHFGDMTTILLPKRLQKKQLPLDREKITSEVLW